MNRSITSTDGTTPGNPIEEPTPDRTEMDRARLLAESAHDTLSADGYDNQRIADWAQSFIADQGQPADVDGFIDWVRDVRNNVAAPSRPETEIE